MIKRSLILAATATAALLFEPATALADAIHGNWCSDDGRTMTINGPRIVTPGGTSMTGDYDRHGFIYVIPVGEPGAGGRVVMVLLNEDTVRLTAETGAETWRRCDVISRSQPSLRRFG